MAHWLRRFAAGLLVLGVPSCGPGNTGQTGLDPALVRAVPWVNGGVPELDATGMVNGPFTPVYPPIATGLPDPGSQHTDCSALARYEFSTG